MTCHPAIVRDRSAARAYPRPASRMAPISSRSPRATESSVSLRAKAVTSAAPDRLSHQNQADGRSPAKSTAPMAVASGRRPSTIPPWDAGTATEAKAMATGKPTTVQSAIAMILPRFRRGKGGRAMARSVTATTPATVVRRTVTTSGSSSATERRVDGSEAPNMVTARRPRRKPIVWRDPGMEGPLAGRRDCIRARVSPPARPVMLQTGPGIA